MRKILWCMCILSLMAIPAHAEFAALGRGQTAGRIIYSVSNDAYLLKSGDVITEQIISVLSSADYGKTGLIADGNSRLILRYSSDTPGTVAFSVTPSISGSRLESLVGRQEITGGLNTVSTGNNYQASAVLIAPETWPENITYPSGNFTVTAAFTSADGSAKTETLTLTLRAAPVVLIHGAFSNNEKMFGYATGTKTGVWHKLENAGLKVASWNYDNKKSPKSIISSNTNGLANIIADTLNALNAQGFEAARVDLVTHSSGGIMARQYLRNDIDTGNRTANSYGLGTVRRVVTIASPNLGTPIGSYLSGKFSTLPTSWQNWAGKSWWEGTGYTLLRMLALNGAEEAMGDLSLSSAYIAGLGYPGVPFHSIYGKVKSDDAKINQLFDDVVNQNIVNLSRIDWLPQHLVDTLTSSKLGLISGVVSAMSDDIRFKELLGALYGDDDHDLVVSEPSARDIFPSNAATSFTGLGKYNHVMIGQQNDVGDRVLALLRGGTENFMINTVSTTEYDAAFDSVANSFVEYLRASDEGDLSGYFDENMTLETSDPATEYMGDDSGDEPVIQSVKLSGKSSSAFSDDIYVMLEDGEGTAKFFTVKPSGRTSFDVDMWAGREDKGLYEVSYFTVQDGKLKISRTKTIAYPPMFSSSETLALNASGTVYAHAGEEVPVGLVVRSGSGNYDISAPSLGVVSYDVSDPSVVQITDAGELKALKEGTATIRAAAYGQTASINFIVKSTASEADTTKDIGENSTASTGSSSSGCSTGLGTLTLLAAITLFMKKH